MKLKEISENYIYILNYKISFYKHIILTVSIMLILLLLLFFPYDNYLDYILYIDNDYKLLVDEKFFPIKNKYLYINHKKYFYSVKNISEPKILDNKTYFEVILDIDSLNLKDNNIIKVKVLNGKTTVFKKFIYNERVVK